MTLRKLTEEKMQQLQTLKKTFATLSDNIEGCPWFGPTMKQHLIQVQLYLETSILPHLLMVARLKEALYNKE